MEGKDALHDVVETNLRRFQGNYPIDVSDQVFIGIEFDPAQLKVYKAAVAQDGQSAVNERIAALIQQITGLKNMGPCDTPLSTLIKSYEKFG